MDPQHIQPAIHARINRKHRGRKPPHSAQGKKSPKRRDQPFSGRYSVQPIVKAHQITPQKAPFNDIQPDMMPAVGEEDMLCSPDIGRNRQPGRQITQRDRVRVGNTTVLHAHRNRQDGRIEVSTPNHPGQRGRVIGIFGESAAPSTPACRWPGSRRWRRHTRQYSRGRAAATPTSARPDRGRAGRDRSCRRASFPEASGPRFPSCGNPAGHT